MSALATRSGTEPTKSSSFAGDVGGELAQPTSGGLRQWRAWVSPLAGAWSLMYGALGLFWTLGGPGYPFGENDAGSAEWMSLLHSLPVEVGGPLTAVLSLTGVVVALAMTRSWGHGLIRGLMLSFGWAACATLLLLVPDARILALLGYLPVLIFTLGFDVVEWPIVNQAVCVVGGFSWGAATLEYQRRTRSTNHDSRIDAVARWTSPSAARQWGRWATLIVVVAPLPYAVTRFAWALGIPLGLDRVGQVGAGTDTGATRITEVTLGGLAFAGALLALGLVQRWGEVFPRWVPALGGKPVPPGLAIVPAMLMSIALTVGGLTMIRLHIAGRFDGAGWGAGTPTLLFLPWGVALGLATLAYSYRRRGGSLPGSGNPRGG